MTVDIRSCIFVTVCLMLFSGFSSCQYTRQQAVHIATVMGHPDVAKAIKEMP